MDFEMLRPFLLPVISCIATYVLLVKKLEFEIQQLRKDTDKQEQAIAANARAITEVKENGSLPSSHLDERVKKMEGEFADMKKSIDDVKHTLARNEASMSEIKGSLMEIKGFMSTQIERRTRGRK